MIHPYINEHKLLLKCYQYYFDYYANSGLLARAAERAGALGMLIILDPNEESVCNLFIIFFFFCLSYHNFLCNFLFSSHSSSHYPLCLCRLIYFQYSGHRIAGFTENIKIPVLVAEKSVVEFISANVNNISFMDIPGITSDGKKKKKKEKKVNN